MQFEESGNGEDLVKLGFYIGAQILPTALGITEHTGTVVKIQGSQFHKDGVGRVNGLMISVDLNRATPEVMDLIDRLVLHLDSEDPLPASAMPFTRIKKIKGREYRYEITTYREPDTGKVRQKSRYLGKVEPQPEPEPPVSLSHPILKYGDRVLYQRREGIKLGGVFGCPDLLYCKFGEDYETVPAADVIRCPVVGERVQLTLTLYGEPRLVTGTVVEVPGCPVGAVGVEWSWGEAEGREQRVKGVVQVPVGRFTPPPWRGTGKIPVECS